MFCGTTASMDWVLLVSQWLDGTKPPIGIVLAALLFGSLYAWGESIQLQVDVLQTRY